MINKLRYYIFIILLVGNAHGADIMFYMHGGAATSYKSDKVIVSSSKVSLTTIAPTFAAYPNLIGEFSIPYSRKDFDSLETHLKQQLQFISDPKDQPPSGSVVEELHVSNEKRFWESDTQSPTIVEVRKKFLKLAKKAYAKPEKALKLECSQSKNLIKCSYLNVGKETVSTVDPLGVTYSLQCLDVTNRRTILNKEGEFNPNQMKPKRISIKPSDKYAFQFQTDVICDYRMIVKTSDLIINKNYKDVLLGELVSEILSK